MSWKDYFHFSVSEKRGIFVLFVLSVFFFVASEFADLFVPKHQVDIEKYESLVAQFEANLQNIDSNATENRLNRYLLARYDTLSLFDFDPNQVTEEQWRKLGLTNKQIKTVLNYTKKGGRFETKNDFRKMYGIRTKQFQILEPYIRIRNKHKPVLVTNDIKAEKITKTELFDFDPNTATKEQFMLLGLSPKVVGNIIIYRKKGGKFVAPNDFRRIYGLSSQEYEKFKPFIQIQSIETEVVSAKENIAVDLNSADVEELVKIYGIGQYFAKMIIEYRKKLGGYYSVKQLLEIDKMDEQKLNRIKPYVFVDTSRICLININTADISLLMKHPYIDYAIAKQIVDVKNNEGKYKSLKQLLDSKILIKRNYKVLVNYLTVD